MGKLFPPFKVDIAGALCVPFALRDARSRYQHGQISLSALRAIENEEICKLMERLKSEGIEVVTDGGFRSYDFLEGWEGIRCRDNADSSLEKKQEVTGRIGLLHHPILEDFVFLLKNTAAAMRAWRRGRFGVCFYRNDGNPTACNGKTDCP